MLDNLWQEAKKINVFGKNLQLENDFSTRSNSIQSFILTVLLLIATIVVGFIFGQEIYLRKNPQYTSSKATITNEESLINFLELPIIFKFLNNVGSPIDDVNIVNKLITASLITFDIIDGDGQKSNFSNIKECNLEDYNNSTRFEKIKGIVNSRGISFCLDPKSVMMNKKAAFNSKNILVIFNKCKKNCLPNIDEFLEGAYIGLNFIDEYIIPSSYSTPIENVEKIEMIKLSTKISKEINLSFQKNILKTNKGWIFEDFVQENYISYASFISEVFISQNELIRMFIDSPTFVDLNVREYMKIQDLLANIGGFFNAIYIIFSVCFTHYISFTYYHSIFESFYLLGNYDSKEQTNNKKTVSSNILRNNFVSQENLNSEKMQKENSENSNKHLKNRFSNNQARILKKLNNDQEREKNENAIRNEENQRNERNEENDRNENQEKPFNEKEFSLENYKEKVDHEYTSYYIVYVFNKIICCKNYNKKMYEFCSKILSFDYYLQQAKKTNIDLLVK